MACLRSLNRQNTFTISLPKCMRVSCEPDMIVFSFRNHRFRPHLSLNQKKRIDLFHYQKRWAVTANIHRLKNTVSVTVRRKNHHSCPLRDVSMAMQNLFQTANHLLRILRTVKKSTEHYSSSSSSLSLAFTPWSKEVKKAHEFSNSSTVYGAWKCPSSLHRTWAVLGKTSPSRKGARLKSGQFL